MEYDYQILCMQKKRAGMEVNKHSSSFHSQLAKKLYLPQDLLQQLSQNQKIPKLIIFSL